MTIRHRLARLEKSVTGPCDVCGGRWTSVCQDLEIGEQAEEAVWPAWPPAGAPETCHCGRELTYRRLTIVLGGDPAGLVRGSVSAPLVMIRRLQGLLNQEQKWPGPWLVNQHGGLSAVRPPDDARNEAR